MAETAVAPAVEATPANPAVAASAAKPEAIRKYKVGDKEFEVPESKLDERVAKSFGAEEAMKKAADMERAFANFVSRAQDPQQLIDLLQHPALKYDDDKKEALLTQILSSKNPRIVAAVKKWIYENEVEPSTMTPEQRRLRELEAYKTDQDRKQQNEEARHLQEREQQQISQHWNAYRTKIGEELKSTGLTPNESRVARVARYALLYTRQGKPPDIKDCVARVKRDLLAEFTEHHADATEDNILDRVPEDLAKKINAALLKRLKAKDKEAGVKAALPSRPRDGLSREERGRLKREETRNWLRDVERRRG